AHHAPQPPPFPYTTLFRSAGEVPVLAHVAEVGRVERLHADQDPEAAAAGHQVQQLAVAGDVDAGLADPVDLQGDQLPAQLAGPRSEEHTSELQSRFDLVCR